MHKTIFDIGANRGEFGLELAKTNPDATFYLFDRHFFEPLFFN